MVQEALIASILDLKELYTSNDNPKKANLP